MEYAYKFRLYPNEVQKNQILRTLGCCRFVYNYYLNLRKTRYRNASEKAHEFIRGMKASY